MIVGRANERDILKVCDINQVYVRLCNLEKGICLRALSARFRRWTLSSSINATIAVLLDTGKRPKKLDSKKWRIKTGTNANNERGKKQKKNSTYVYLPSSRRALFPRWHNTMTRYKYINDLSRLYIINIFLQTETHARYIRG